MNVKQLLNWLAFLFLLINGYTTACNYFLDICSQLATITLMIKAGPKVLKIYVTFDGKQPYSEWLRNLRDTMTVARIRTRIDRIEEESS